MHFKARAAKPGGTSAAIAETCAEAGGIGEDNTPFTLPTAKRKETKDTRKTDHFVEVLLH